MSDEAGVPPQVVQLRGSCPWSLRCCATLSVSGCQGIPETRMTVPDSTPVVFTNSVQESDVGRIVTSTELVLLSLSTMMSQEKAGIAHMKEKEVVMETSSRSSSE